MFFVSSYNHISQPAFGWKINFIVLGVSTFFSIFYYFRYEVVNNGTFWTPPATCAQYPAGFRVPNFVLQEREFYKAANGLFRTINLLVVGVLAKFLPCILFPTLTIILTKELKKAVRAREEARKDGAVGKKYKYIKLLGNRDYKWQTFRKEVATRFVIYMTVSFVIIEFPIGICFCIEAASGIYSQGCVSNLFLLSYNWICFRSAASSIIQLLNMVYVVLTLSHFLICFSMSSQYRKTVKQIFSRGPSLQNKAKSVISVVHNRKSQPSSSFWSFSLVSF